MNIVPQLTLLKPEQSRYDFLPASPDHDGDLRAHLDGQPAVVTSMRKGLYQIVADVPQPECPATFKKTLVIWDAAMAPTFVIELSFESDTVWPSPPRLLPPSVPL
jgi:hypothetical protein